MIVLEGEVKASIIEDTPDVTTAGIMSVSHNWSVDYSKVSGTRIYLANLEKFVVPGAVRDMTEIYEVEHCLVQDVVPLTGEDIWYSACSKCKKKCLAQLIQMQQPAESSWALFSSVISRTRSRQRP